MKIEYPGPHAAVSLGPRQTFPVEEGYVVAPEKHAEAVMAGLSRAYGVDYDEDGSVINEEVCGTVMSDGAVCERPADTCGYHNEKSE